MTNSNQYQIKALIYFTNPSCEYENSVLYGKDMTELLFGEQMEETKDGIGRLYFKTLPKVGEHIYLYGTGFEFVVEKIHHCVGTQTNSLSHVVKILLSQVPLGQWDETKIF